MKQTVKIILTIFIILASGHIQAQPRDSKSSTDAKDSVKASTHSRSQDLNEAGRPLTLPNIEMVQLIEGKNYCYAGYGSQTFTLVAGSEHKVYREGDSFLIIPKPDPAKMTTNVQLGCTFNSWKVDYSLTDASFLFDSSFKDEGTRYNSVDLQHNTLSFGYSQMLIKHYIYAGIGMGSAKTTYNYSYSSSSSNYTGSTKTDQFLFAKADLDVFLSPFIFVRWKLEESLDRTALVRETNTLSLNFYARF